MKLVFSHFLPVSLCAFGYLYAPGDITLAQVTSDNTVNTTVNQNGNVAEITDGTTKGDNLFHSFKEFSIPNGNEAFFNNATNISNIFSRVTGGNVSNIDGLIRANGNASLFLINPQGIIFGEGASLDIGGSFYGSSASSILFEDGEFSAVDLENPPLLTVNAPVGLSFREQPGEIVNKSIANDVGLAVAEGNNISLLGGDINLQGGRVTAPGGIVELGGLSTSDTIGISEDGSFNFPEGVARSDVSLTKQAAVNVRAGGGGFININAQNLSLSERSELFAGIAEGRGSEDAVAGDININATESVKIVGKKDTSTGETLDELIENFIISRNKDVGIRNNVGLSSVKRDPVTNRSSALGKGGDINITTGTLELLNVSSIDTNLYGTGEGGDINITAEDISLTGSQSVLVAEVGGFNFDVVKEQGRGDGGNVNINTGSITFNDRAGILADVQSGAIGNGGDIIINATDAVTFTGGEAPHFVLTQLGSDAVGSGGDIKITADTLNLTNAQLIADLQSGAEGEGGNIKLDIAGDISIDEGSLVLSQVQEEAIGDSGDIVIDSNNLTVNGGSLILADTKGEGNAGNITFKVADTFTVNESSFILNQVQPNSIGNAGNIKIDTTNFKIENSQLLSDNRGGEGDSGDIDINASEAILINDNSIVLTELGPNAVGNAGNLTISAPEITVDNLSILASDARVGSRGEAGNITLNTDTLRVANGSGVNAFTETQFDAGNVTVNANTAEIVAGGKMIMATDSGGNAGNITLNIADSLTIDGNNPLLRPEPLNVPVIDALNPDTGLFANTSVKSTGDGGTIRVNEVNSLNLINNAKISVASEGAGSGGNIFVDSDLLNLNNQAEITAATAFGTGGNINLTIGDRLNLRNNSLISAQATGTANGGNVNIDTDFVVAFPNTLGGNGSDIIASAAEGDGGKISINAESIFGIQEGQAIEGNNTNEFDASSDFGLDGTVSITTPDVNALQGATELPSNIVVPEQTTSQACQANRETQAANRLIINGKGGIPPTPFEPLNSAYISINGKNTNELTSISPQAIPTAQGDIIPARGVVKTKDGRIILSAHPTDNQGNRLPQSSPNCS